MYTQQNPEVVSDELAIRELFQHTNEAWGDADAYVSHFTEDADYIAFDGTYSSGCSAIAEAHRPLFQGILKGSRLAGQITALRFLAPDVALLHCSGGVMRGKQRQPSRSALSVQTMVAIKQNDQWRFAAFQNTRYRPFAQTLLGKLIALFPRQKKQ